MNVAAEKSPPAIAALSRLRGFESGAREIDDAAVHVDGDLPAWLRGSCPPPPELSWKARKACPEAQGKSKGWSDSV